MTFSYLQLLVYGLVILVVWELSKRIGRKSVEKEDAVLWCLKHEPGMTGRQICAVTGISRSSIYVYLARLEDRGAVRMVRPDGPFPQSFKYYAVEHETVVDSALEPRGE